MIDNWAARVRAVWESAGDSPVSETVAAIDALVAERDPDDPAALFEAAGARDFADREAEAEPLYRQALASGLPEPNRGRALIQLASTLRNLARYDEALAVLDDGFGAPSARDHPLAQVAAAFRALTLASSGSDRIAAATAIEAMSGQLPEYGAVVARYARELLD
jgi:tetratricopeptide (TPR) repeat protein